MPAARHSDAARGYVGRFAPSPTGLLHAGSLVAALASWLDARAHGGRWLVRIEDVDTPRCQPGAAEAILQQLSCCGLLPDEVPLWQSTRSAAYARALAQLVQAGHAYPCTCSRKAIELALLARGWQPQRHGEKVYPGTCRPDGLGLPSPLVGEGLGERGTPQAGFDGTPPDARPPAWRLRTDAADGTDTLVRWHDRRLGAQTQNLSREVGDFVLRRADGLWAYQLAVVVDDAAQQVTDVVRGEDLADNTPRQRHLQQLLGLPAPRYLHTPLVLAADGQKLSKQNGARALDLTDPLAALHQAACALGLAPAALVPRPGEALADWLGRAVCAWRDSGIIPGSSGAASAGLTPSHA